MHDCKDEINLFPPNHPAYFRHHVFARNRLHEPRPLLIAPANCLGGPQLPYLVGVGIGQALHKLVRKLRSGRGRKKHRFLGELGECQ